MPLVGVTPAVLFAIEACELTLRVPVREKLGGRPGASEVGVGRPVVEGRTCGVRRSLSGAIWRAAEDIGG